MKAPNQSKEGGSTKRFKYILNQTDLGGWEKLTYIIIDLEQPCSYEEILKGTGLNLDSAKTVVNLLLAKGLIVPSKKSESLFYPAFNLETPISLPKKKEEKMEKEKTTLTQEDKDTNLLVKKVEEFYSQRGMPPKISKNGYKQLIRVVRYLNKVWEARELREELQVFEWKGDLYESYIRFAFQNLEDDDPQLKHIKRLTYATTKSAWRAHLKNAFIRFKPYLLDDFSSNEIFIGVPREEIPKDPKEIGHWTTVTAFLLNKMEDKSYPVCKPVLYALERVIVAHLYRKQTVADLIKVHSRYVKEYVLAETRGTLDDLAEYITKDKKKSNICHDCTLAPDCTTAINKAYVTNCTAKITK